MAYLDDDLAFLFSADAEDVTTATVTVSGTPSTVYGYFNRPGSTLDLGTGAVISSDPTFEVRASDVPSFNKKTDTITISGTAYNVLNYQASQDGRVTVYFLGRD